MKPEKKVEAEVLAACIHLGLDVDVFDSKAVYSEHKKGYTKSKAAPEGCSDIIGNTPQGIAVFIELKAKGKLSGIRPKQREFLLRKAQAGCFACCVDSVDLLFSLYLGWKVEGRELLQAHLSSL